MTKLQLQNYIDNLYPDLEKYMDDNGAEYNDWMKEK
jgi:hypothetical protein